MSSHTKKTFAWIWIAALSIATVGVSMQRIYCYCIGEATTSLFVLADDPCLSEQRIAEPDCCAKPEPSGKFACCTQAGETCSASEHDGCMEKSTKVFQLKTEFLVDKPLEKTFDCPLWLREMPLFKRYLRPAMCEVTPAQAQRPPPLSGRDICLLHQLFRC
jgi:hypothetical protein